jgi:xeroderma pigmentosum group C-complementing protein
MVLLLDGHARDVTLRYATQYGARTMKSRLSSNRGQGNWWLAIISLFKRPYHLVSAFCH